MLLLLVTVALFPFLYLTLELPKRIINDAIGAGRDTVVVAGFELEQVTFLAVLCAAFLASVLVHGILKMRINTMKGILAERMLRRFRYQLVSRLFRFPKAYFQRTSQAEIVSMVTAESEPLGGMMGDALSQPVLQAGQMLTILTFLFLQSFWFGLAAVALIPLQAWIIPILQRRINKLNKKRIREVRKLAAEIGETAAGSAALRTSGGYRYRAAQITHRLGRLFYIRLDIYKKKFFMKFLNNFITQLTPFFFFSIGGYLVIQGNVSLGALVAALAAYKDLSSPWKELLTYYNMAYEMSQRWTLITEHFQPNGMLDESLLSGRPEKIPHLRGDIVLDGVSARDGDGIAVIENVNLTFPKGGLVAIAAPNEEDRRVMAELLTRELLPSDGQITIAGHKLNELHQSVIGARIGWADSKPYLFAGTIGDNMMMSLKIHNGTEKLSPELEANRLEAIRADNSRYLIEDNWIDPSLAGLNDLSEIQSWWLKMIEGMGADHDLMRRGLGLKTTKALTPEVTDALVDLRTTIRERLDGDGLLYTVLPFDQSRYNPAVPLMNNILFAAPRTAVDQTELASDPEFLKLVQDLGLVDDLFELALSVTELLHTTFGNDGTDHPLFQRLGIERAGFEATLKISSDAKGKSAKKLADDDLALLLALPCLLSPDQVGQFVPEEVQKQIVAQRSAKTDAVRDRLSGFYEPLDPARYAAGLTILENAIFGVVNKDAGMRIEMLHNTIVAVLIEHGLKGKIATLTYSEETTLGGANLPPQISERIAFTRAAIKRPDILVLNKVLASYDDETRFSASIRLREELPEATIIYLEESFRHPENFDVYVELQHGKIKKGSEQPEEASEPQAAAPDLATKLQALEKTVFFSGLDRKELRLLAFSAQWFNKPAGEVVFEKHDDPSDGVYLVLEGEADFIVPHDDGSETHIRTVGPGSLVGELALILGEPRTLTMRAKTDLAGLRIGGEEFLAVVQNDAATTFKLLQLITGYLSKVPE